MSTLFDASFLLVAPFWLLMVFFPVWGWTQRVVRSPWIAAPAALLYAALVIPDLPRVLASVAQPDLASISALLGTQSGATIAWVHFLAFDLFVGRWIYLEGRARGVTPWLISPILVATLMLGPLGLLLYLLVRALYPASARDTKGSHQASDALRAPRSSGERLDP